MLQLAALHLKTGRKDLEEKYPQIPIKAFRHLVSYRYLLLLFSSQKSGTRFSLTFSAADSGSK
jgi:hypothetical protein